MKIKVIAIDIIVMVVYISIPLVNIIIPILNYPYYRYIFYIMYLYTFIKCIFGIIILLHKIFIKDKIFYSWKYLIFLLPSVILVVFYVYFIFILTKLTFNINEIKFVLMPLSKGLYMVSFDEIEYIIIYNYISWYYILANLLDLF